MAQLTDKTQLLLRLAACGGGAALLYGGALRLPALADRRAWLEDHKLQVIALGAAALYGLSLLAFPRPDGDLDGPDPGGCGGYEPVE